MTETQRKEVANYFRHLATQIEIGSLVKVSVEWDGGVEVKARYSTVASLAHISIMLDLPPSPAPANGGRGNGTLTELLEGPVCSNCGKPEMAPGFVLIREADGKYSCMTCRMPKPPRAPFPPLLEEEARAKCHQPCICCRGGDGPCCANKCCSRRG